MEAWQEKEQAAEPLPQVRCLTCSRLLFYGLAKRVEIKCPKCGRLQCVNNIQCQ